MVIETKKKVPLEWAALALIQISEQIEESEEHLDAAIVAAFSDIQLSVAEAIDRRKGLKSYLQMMIERCKQGKVEVNETQKRFERILEKLTEDTKRIIEANPEVPYIDSLGKKVSVIKNGQPRLDMKLTETNKNVGHVIDLAQCEFLNVDHKYIKTVSYLTLDTETIKADLKAGINLPWAELIFSTQLRGL